MDEVLAERRLSVMGWGKRCVPKMPSSTIHAIHESGSTSPENVAKLARAVGIRPQDVWVRIGWWDEELPAENPNLRRIAEALKPLPDDLQELGADLAVGSIEKLLRPEAQRAIRPYLREVTHQGDESSE